MEMLYAVHKKSGTLNNILLDSFLNNNRKPTLCTVSTRNVIAYTTDTDINECDGNHLSGFYVYLADLNTPWLTYKVTTNKFPISILDWDILGKYLLVGDISGNIQIFVQKDSLLSEWIQYYHVRLPGEHIIKAAFFHNGRKLVLQPDKKDITNYMEKFQRAKFLPSCRSFGGVPADGVLVVTATGLLGAFLIPPDLPNLNKLATNPPTLPQMLTPVTQSLGRTRSFITIADICYSKNGNFMIAVANGTNDNPASTMVHCYRVSVKKQMDSLTLTSQSLPSFFLTGGAARDIPDISITYLKWIYSEDSDSLLVGSKTLTGCFIELWGLMEKATPIHSHFKHLFQQPNKTEVFKTFVWTHQVNYRYSSRIIDICASKFQYGSSSYIFVSMADNTIHCLHRDTLKRLTNASLTCVWRNENDHVSKQTKIDSTIVAHDITWMGHLLLAVDAEGQLYAYRVSYPHQEQAGGQLSINLNYAVSLLEYCLVGGFDALDVFLILKVQQLDTIIDRLTENFTRQPAFVQQFFYVNFFAMKSNLYRLSVSGLPKAHDLTCFLMLHSILIGFKSLLRPSVLSSHDKGPAENLAMVLSESVPADIDRLLLNLEVKEFSVEASTLQSLQQLIQWVADLALNILAKLPDNRGMSGMNRSTGYDISKDIVALNSIRELLVVMRMWGLVRSQCLPVFSRSAENLDVLATLYKLLTRLTLNPNEPDEVLLDECCLLPSQVLIPQLQLISPQYCIASPIMFYLTNNNLPLRLEYNAEPQCLKINAECAPNEGSMSENIIDSIRHIQLGKKPGAVRRCTRCGAYSSLNSVARTPAMRSWELRWASGCRCGGFWRLNVSQT